MFGECSHGVVGWLGLEFGVTGDSDCVGLGAEIWFMGYRSIRGTLDIWISPTYDILIPASSVLPDGFRQLWY